MNQLDYDNWLNYHSYEYHESFSGHDHILKNEKYFIQKYAKSKVLDLGCGTGNRMGEYYYKNKIDWKGIDFCKHLIEASRYKENIQIADLSKEYFLSAEEKYNLSVCIGGVICGLLCEKRRDAFWKNIAKMLEMNCEYFLFDTVYWTFGFCGCKKGVTRKLFPFLPPQYFPSELELQQIFDDNNLEIVEKKLEVFNGINRIHYLIKKKER